MIAKVTMSHIHKLPLAIKEIPWLSPDSPGRWEPCKLYISPSYDSMNTQCDLCKQGIFSSAYSNVNFPIPIIFTIQPTKI